MIDQQKRKTLLAHCDERFHPYIDKVLQRLPAEVLENEVLNHSGLRIISSDVGGCLGRFIEFEPHTHCLILLNEELLAKPEFEVVHVIAHEIAHKVASKRQDPRHLGEMEAENLVVEWGFQKESEAVNYNRPILEGMGFEVGYKWAISNDLSPFEEFYDEWNEARLSTRRYQELHYQANTYSVLYDEGCLEEVDEGEADKTTQEQSLVDDGSLDTGIIAGIMYALREKKAKTKASHIGDFHFEFMEQMKRVHTEIGKLFPTSVYSRYREQLPAVSQAYCEIGDVLDAVKQG